MTSIVGPDGRSVKAEAPGGTHCLLCVVTELLPEVVTSAETSAVERQIDEAVSHAVAEGLYAGLKVLVQVLTGSGLEPDKAAEVLLAAASFCPTCQAECTAIELSGRAREAVETAIGNIRSKSVFLVGRGPGGTKVL